MARYFVERHRAGDGAPSLRLGYVARTHRGALAEHFRQYPGGVAEGTRYVVVAAERRGPVAVFDTTTARSVWREAQR